MEKELIVDVYVICYNELRITKFVLDYWNEFATNVYVYNNQSTDGCIELMKQETRFNIEIIDFDTNGKLDDYRHSDIKNNEWKKSKGKADFVVVSDFDEILFSKNIMTELKHMKKNGYSVCQPNTYNMFSETMPEYDGQLLHNLIQTGYYDPLFGKMILFDPNKINEIKYCPGAHTARPIGEVKFYKKHGIFMLHFKNIDFNFLYEKHKKYAQRLSEYNLRYFWGIHYKYDYKRQFDDFNKGLKKSINVKELIDVSFNPE